MTVQSTGKLGVNFSDDTASAQFALGEVVSAEGGRQMQYVQAGSAVAANLWVCIDSDDKAYPLTKARVDDGQSVGVAESALTINQYGWITMTGRNVNAAVGASCAADVALYTSATAGVLDDTSTSQTKVDGVVAAAANGTAAQANVEVIMTWPKSTTF